MRHSGEDYISHPLAVAEILGDMRMDSRTIIAAILHDVIEDTDTSLTQLSAYFGKDVAELVDGVSKVSQLEIHSRFNVEAASFQKMFMAMAKDIRVIIIKLADRLHNMRTLRVLELEKKQRIARQTMEIYAPMANRLGMRELGQELEDLGFASLFPKRYRAISKCIAANKRGRKPAVKELCVAIRQGLYTAGVAAEVHGREKTLYSIYRKMQKKRLPLREVQDVNAVRVLTRDRLSCYQVLGIVHRLYNPRPESFKDYIAIPKVNGYQSLHTIVVGPHGQQVEVQVRSQAMHHIAEQGVASHWQYKTDVAGEQNPQQLAQRWLDSFLESQKKSVDSGEYLEHLKADLYPDKVYVFTPKGEIKRLPRGATALDFAYSVHSGVGNRCVGARVNHVAAPLHETLNNGDTVEIITARSARPQPSWLSYAVSSKSRSFIRHYLNQQKEKEALKLGGKLLKKALRDHGYKRLRIPSAEKINLLRYLKLNDWQQLLIDIGFGRRLPVLVAKQFVAENKDSTDGSLRHVTSGMAIDGTERLLVNYANCCHPVPGDDIIGTTTVGRGLVIHRLRCPNCKAIMKHPDNYLHLNWSEPTQGSFQVMIKLETRNKPGVLAGVTGIIAEFDANINHVTVDPKYGNTSHMRLNIEVTDRKHLADIMRQLHVAPAVIKLARA